MVRTLMAHSPCLARTIIIVDTDNFMHNTLWMAGTTALDHYLEYICDHQEKLLLCMGVKCLLI